jgi:type II secretory pathway component PulM
MILTKRERYIAVSTGALVGVLLIYFLLVGPYIDRRSEIAAEVDSARSDKDKADMLFRQQIRMRKVWNEMINGGLSSSQSDAESQLQLALNDWSRDCGVTVSKLKDERSTADGKFVQIGFHLTGTGPLATISNLLWRVETTTMPLRVSEIQVTPLKEGVDDLQLELSLSTLCRVPDADKPDHLRTASIQGGGQ